MKHIFVLVAAVGAGSAALLGSSSRPPASRRHSSSRSPTHHQRCRRGCRRSSAIAGFIPLSQDAETVAAAKTIGDVLYDDINYEREYYMIGKDAIATIPKPTSLDERAAGSLERAQRQRRHRRHRRRRRAAGVVVQVKLIDVSSGKQAFGKRYSGSIANPRRYAHTISDEIFQDQLALRGVARTKLAFSSDRQRELAKGGVAQPRHAGDLLSSTTTAPTRCA